MHVSSYKPPIYTYCSSRGGLVRGQDSAVFSGDLERWYPLLYDIWYVLKTSLTQKETYQSDCNYGVSTEADSSGQQN